MGVDINWGILRPVDVGGEMQRGYEQGRQRHAENALSQYAQNPNDPKSLNALAKYAPQQALQVRQQQAAAAKAAQGEQRDEMLIMGKLLDSATDEASYQNGLQVAQRYGIDVAGAPPNFDPNWVNQQKMLVNAFGENKDKLPMIVQELQAAGYEPGTPEFIEQIRGTLKARNTVAVPFGPGGGAAAYDKVNGITTPLVIPNSGQGQVGQVVAQPKVLDGVTYYPTADGQWTTDAPTGGQPEGGQSPFRSTPPQQLKHGTMTSGRRTIEGNRAVGGVDNSPHLDGHGVDYDGPNLNALLGEVRQTFPGAKAFIHKGHVHVQDPRINAPYFGKNGTRGLKR
jgi:hypothetical protein